MQILINTSNTFNKNKTNKKQNKTDKIIEQDEINFKIETNLFLYFLSKYFNTYFHIILFFYYFNSF